MLGWWMMTNIDIHTEVFNAAYIPHIGNQTPLQIYYGGSASGKSVFLAQRAVLDLMRSGRNYLVCRQVGRTIRGSVSQEIQKIIGAWGLQQLFSINKTDGTITCANGHQIIFSGLDDVEKLKSITPAKGVLTDIWVEEATEIDQPSMKQLEKRLRGGSERVAKRIILSFNPIMQNHWIYREYFTPAAMSDKQTEYQSDAVSILKTTYKDNRFLTAQDIDRLENEKDDYYYNVYTLGNWGVLGDVIFTNWRVEDLSGMHDQFTNHRTGLDFGFSSDPAALWVAHYDKPKKTIYVYDELYERGLTNDVLAGILVEMVGQRYVTCDSAEPKSIKELQNAGVYALGARKGKDSVNFGIQWLQQQTIVFDKGCINAISEFSTAHWKKDKDGNSLRTPSDKNNHLIDAARYAHEQDSTETETTSIENPLWL
jgi:phage terminase large subunit